MHLSMNGGPLKKTISNGDLIRIQHSLETDGDIKV